MKKLSFSAILAAACLLPGCSNDNEPINTGSSMVEAEIGDSEVEIKLSSSTQATRTSIESNEYGAFEVEGLGIYCAAKGKQNPEINPPAPDVDWTRYYDPTKTDVLMFNVPANAVVTPKTPSNPEYVGDTLQTSIEWADAEKHYFYPISNWYMYDFYGYYPVQPDDNVFVSPDSIQVLMELDGHKDVLYGYAGSDEEYAYSAKYFRAAEHATPMMLFMHRFSRFTFSVEAGADYTGSRANATRMKVKSIQVLDMPSLILLTVAHRTDGIGYILYDGDNLTEYDLLDENDSLLTPVQVPETGRNKIGESLMVLPGLLSYGIRVTLEDEEGNEFVSEFPLSISEHIEEGTPQVGHSYNINMTVYGPQEVKLNAVLKPWVVEETDIPIEL